MKASDRKSHFEIVFIKPQINIFPLNDKTLSFPIMKTWITDCIVGVRKAARMMLGSGDIRGSHLCPQRACYQAKETEKENCW